MLPDILTNNLCSLHPGVERYAFSVFQEITPKGKLVGEPKFRKTIIKSCAKLSYEVVQKILD